MTHNKQHSIWLYRLYSHTLCVRVCVWPVQVCVTFNPQSTLIATGSMDTTAKLWDVESGKAVSTLEVSISVSVFIPNSQFGPLAILKVVLLL